MKQFAIIIAAILPWAALHLTHCSGDQHTMSPQSPFRLTLHEKENHEIEALLKNVSSHPQTYLHDIDLQPSEPVVKKGGKEALKPFDERSIKKFDPTVYQFMYLTLSPGEEIVLHSSRFIQKGDGSYEFRWPPYEFSQISPGVYTVAILWKSAESSYKDSETNALGTIDSIWIGTLSSDTLSIRLPEMPKGGQEKRK